MIISANKKGLGFTLTKAFKRMERGFTLIELLVVVSIIGLLATLVTANLNAARSRSRDTVRKADLKSLQTALRIYYNDEGDYPTSLPTAGTEFKSSDGSVTYMNKIPDDPLPDQDYSYVNDSANDIFYLTACLENTSDTNCGTVSTGTTQPGFTCASGCYYQTKP